MVELAQLVLEAKRKEDQAKQGNGRHSESNDGVYKHQSHHHDSAYAPGPDVSGQTGAGVPTAHKLDEVAAVSGGGRGSTTPNSPSSPTRQNGGTPKPSKPKHRSQASFDWFGDAQGSGSSGDSFARNASPSRYSRGKKEQGRSPGANSAPSGTANGTPNRWMSDGPMTSNSLTEDPEDLDDSQHEDASQSQSTTSGLRGAFTAEDKQRGMKALRQSSGESESEVLREPRARSASMGASGVRKSGEARRRARSSSLNRGTKSVRQTSGDETRSSALREEDGEGEWEDEERDAVGEPSRNKQANGGTGRKLGGLTNAAAGLFTAGGASGTSTPDNRSEHGEDGPSGNKRPGPQRRSSAWGAVKQKLAKNTNKPPKQKTGETLAGSELVAELTTGMLPMVLIKMSLMDRDERGDHRIPILMNYLKLRITDSLYPFHDRHAVFRIELEYGDSAVKWVIYRELKDFVNLHAHYRVANLRQGVDKFPAFPKTSIPYLNWLKVERGNVSKADFARTQRESLENYLLKLIRATMFRPEANRLCKFLEISAMSLSLATRGGEQGKQGYLTITSSNASRKRPPGFHPLIWKDRHSPKWFIVRDSYVVAVSDPASTEIYDVILVDFTFELERPTRILRQGLQLVKGARDDDDLVGMEDVPEDLRSEAKKPLGHRGAGDPADPSTTNTEGVRLKETSNHTFYLKTSERKLRLVAKTERQQDQFIASIEKMLAKTIWSGRNRFDSFAPIRLNASAQWLIDGRDYYWSLSRAILLAKHKIYIHDWWLSPELYLRRPPALNEQWRLDRLLQRKAREGVQIFVIVYKEVSNDFTPVESGYTKQQLRGLHPNIHVQRSPDHTSTGTLFWSHHEKMCVIDETIGFMGGLDLCFGRWDTPGHVLTDEGPKVSFNPDMAHADQETRERSQIWPGKDYSNERVLEFHTLSKPGEDMYDRSKVPRQPWHDIGLQIIGQPARDLCRHFIQRWNYLLRNKNHTIHMPFLLPAPDFTPKQLHEQRITGTCEIQICRSVGPWSMGIQHIEHSIQNAYCKAIQLSDHFVYIENQFFITSTTVEGTVIENRVGDALVSRILRAHSEGTKWRAVVVIPLVPGYPYPIDHSDAGSVRLIMECQFASICRGEKSIFARLRREGIDPDEYISFFGLRGWGKLSSGALTTEAVYIHAKSMIVDDRTVIIGSANLNERSQRGDRDSELAAVIRDTDMIDSTMAGKPYKVGRFAHTMRIRLMREHLGVDVDEIEAEEGISEEVRKRERKPEEFQGQDEAWDPDHEQQPHGTGEPVVGTTFSWAGRVGGAMAHNTGAVMHGMKETVGIGIQHGTENMGRSMGIVEDELAGGSKKKIEQEEDETDADQIVAGTRDAPGFASTVVPTLEEKVMAEGWPHSAQKSKRNTEGEPKTLKEREDGVATRVPHIANGDVTYDGKDHEEGTNELKNKHSSTERDAQRQHGEKTTMRSPQTDDTRKLGVKDDVLEKAEKEYTELLRPAPPVTETSRDDVKPHRIQDSMPPPDVSDGAIYNGHGKDSPPSSSDDTASPSTAPTSTGAPISRTGSTTNYSNKANELAVNRNKVTTQLRKNLKEKNVYSIPVPAPIVDPHGFSDPLVDSFYKDVWLAGAVRNTQCYRKVFRCVPDDLVQTWKQYREFQTWAERHNKAPKDVAPSGDEEPYRDPEKHSGVHGAGGGGSAGGVMGQGQHDPPPGDTMYKANSRAGRQTSNVGDVQFVGDAGMSEKSGTQSGAATTHGAENKEKKGRDRASTMGGGDAHDHEEGFPESEKKQMEECLEEVLGTLVVFPTRFLEAESAGGNFLFSKDRLPPLSIYD